MFKMSMYFAKRLHLKHRMPYFVIDFNGPKWDIITYESIDSKFVSGEVFIPNVDSIHFVSDKDTMAAQLKNFRNFEHPTVINHD